MNKPRPQHQGSTRDQLLALYDLANKNGLYDAADVVMQLLDADRYAPAREKLDSGRM